MNQDYNINDEHKSPRGIRGYKLLSSDNSTQFTEWKVAGSECATYTERDPLVDERLQISAAKTPLTMFAVLTTRVDGGSSVSVRFPRNSRAAAMAKYLQAHTSLATMPRLGDSRARHTRGRHLPA